MNTEINKSAAIRATRTILQVLITSLVAFLTHKIPAVRNLNTELETVLWFVVLWFVTYMWRRWVDPTSVPSLVDPDTKVVQEREHQQNDTLVMRFWK